MHLGVTARELVTVSGEECSDKKGYIQTIVYTQPSCGIKTNTIILNWAFSALKIFFKLLTEQSS